MDSINNMNIRKLSPKLESKANKELGEDPQRLADGIKSLKEWIAKQPHLVHNVRTDDQWLAAFIRGCKYRIEMAKNKFDMFYCLRAALPELHENMDPFLPEIQKMLSRGLVVMLPKGESPDSPRIIFSRTGISGPDEFTPEDTSIYHQMLFLYMLLEDDNATIAGLDFIVDIKNTPIEVAKHLTVQNLQRIKVITEKGLPFRYKSLNYINVTPAAESIFSFLKKFMNEKSRSRMALYSKVEDIYETFPKSVLPKEYGGDVYTMQDIIDDTKSKIESLSELFKAETLYKSNESLRPEKPVTKEFLFGVDGNFRQLGYD